MGRPKGSLTPQGREAIRMANSARRGHTHSLEAREKISAAHMGIRPSEETRIKLSKAAKVRCERMAASGAKRVLTPEVRQRLRQLNQERWQSRLQECGGLSGRFWAYVDKSGDCWLWTKSLTIGGYGRFSLSRNSEIRAHRFAWQDINGPISDGLRVCHSCDVNYANGDVTYRRCVRPEHLYLGTDGENMQHAADVGRVWSGPRQPMSAETKAKLSAAKRGKPIKKRG